MQLDPRRYEVAIKELQSELQSTKDELARLKKVTASKIENMFCAAYELKHTASSSTFNLTSTSAYVVGSTLRLYFNGTSKSAYSAGNITNITVVTYVIDNSDLLISDVWNANTTGGSSGVLSQYITGVSKSEDMKKLTVTVTLAAIGTAISSGGTQNAFLSLPVTLNYDAF